MDALLEAILGNFMIIIIVIGGILSLLKDKSGKEKQENPVPQGRQHRAPASPQHHQAEEQYARQQKTETNHAHPAAREVRSAEEQRAEQLKKLAGRIEADVTKTSDELTHGKTAKHKSVKHNLVKQQGLPEAGERMRSKLTKEGLAHSVIMAEVLGSPRAVKPYRPVTAERRMK